MKKGISVFAGLKEYSLENNLAYIELAHRYDYKILFTSLHINEAKESYEQLQAIINKAHECAMIVVVDISKGVVEKLNYLQNIDVIRLDYGFSDQEIVELSYHQQYLIELNASTMTKQHLEALISQGLNTLRTRASFNYYPKLYTAHDLNDVKEKIDLFHQYRITINTFIPSFVGKRPPMYQGLPSVESHRYQSLSISIEELKTITTDEITFGDAYASLEELEQLTKHCENDVLIDLELVNEDYQDLFITEMPIRSDYNSYLLRISTMRSKTAVVESNTIKRERYDVTIDNQLFLRYCGEIAIVLKPLPKDERVNVIGKAMLSSVIVENIKKHQKVKFNVVKGGIKHGKERSIS